MMRNRFKKVTCLVLSFVMVLSMSVHAFASYVKSGTDEAYLDANYGTYTASLSLGVNTEYQKDQWLASAASSVKISKTYGNCVLFVEVTLINASKNIVAGNSSSSGVRETSILASTGGVGIPVNTKLHAHSYCYLKNANGVIQKYSNLDVYSD